MLYRPAFQSANADSSSDIHKLCPLVPDAPVDYVSDTTPTAAVARDAGAVEESNTPAALRIHQVDVLSTKVRRWHVRKKISLTRKPASAVRLMSIRGLNKAKRSKGTVMFMATNVFRPKGEGTEDEDNSIDLTNVHDKPNPIESVLDAERSITERITDKLKGLSARLTSAYTAIFNKFPRLTPSKLPKIETLTNSITHPIDLVDGAKPKSTSIYHCSEPKLAEMKRQITELLEAGLIRHSLSPWAAPVIFVKKKWTTKLRMCIDFRHINKSTVKDATPIARIDELRQRLKGSRYFTAIDLLSGYYQIRIDSNAIPYTAFNCRYGHFEWLVMPFGLCNAPATFSRWINQILGPELDVCAVAYLDDILIYSATEEQHLLDVEMLLSRLDAAGAFMNLDKSFFHKEKIEFLGHNVDCNGITPNNSLVEAVANWPSIKKKADVASFCGMINYFKSWIPDYADLLQPLNILRRKETVFHWTDECTAAVQKLQHALTNAPVLEYFDKDQQTVLTTDASAYAVGGWLGQRSMTDPDALVKPILYWSRKMKDAVTRYGAHEKELLAIVEMLRICRPYLEGRPFIVKTDHEALKYLQDQPTLSRRQAGWIEKIQSADMTIEYLPGKFNSVADALSRRPDYFPNCPRCNGKTIATPDETTVPIQISATLIVAKSPLIDQLRDGYSTAERTEAMSKLALPSAVKPSWKLIDGVFFRGSRIWVPTSMRHKLMYTVHDIGSIHAGRKRTVDLMQRDYWWDGMGKDIKQWLSTCDECQRKARHQRIGRLHSLDIPKYRFSDGSMDFAQAPSDIDGFNQILLYIDRLRKHVTLIPCKDTDTAPDTAKRFADYVVRTQGPPIQRIVAYNNIPHASTRLFPQRDDLWAECLRTTRMLDASVGYR